MASIRPPRPQPFWTSKSFWNVIAAIITNGLAVGAAFGFKLSGEQVAAIMGLLAAVHGVLAVAFRWVADQPLSADPTDDKL